MKKTTLLFIVLITFFSGCRKEEPDNSGNTTTPTGVTETCYNNTGAEILLHDGINREYMLYVPNSYDGTSAVPLLFNFHGFGDDASSFMNTADLRAEAEANTFILVYPQGSCSNGASHWNPCPIGGDNKSTADDVGFVEALIEDLSSRYTINRDRIYAVGYSNGGMMAYGLANYKSDYFAAVASVSGAMLDCTTPASHPMPVLDLHGTSDGVLPYDGDAYYSSVQSTLDFWVDFNNTLETPTTTTDNSGGMTIEHHVYDQGDNSVSVEHYKYIGGGHVWFSTPFQGQSTAQLIWNFLSRYDINGLR